MDAASTLSKYLTVFEKLRRSEGAAPHKPILLLALLDEIERKGFTGNCITPSPELAARFHLYWQGLVPPGGKWQERMDYPSRYMYQEGFWHFIRAGVSVAPDPKRTYTLNQLRSEFDYVQLSPDLWQLLQNQTALDALRKHLLDTYFPNQTAVVTAQAVTQTLDYEAQKLKAEAESKFRVKRVRETTEESGYYVRHALFPRVIKSLYDESCAVCALAARTVAGGGIVDAAHILPFALFHNDDPRNGIAFCKNHHWGFDAGWFTIDRNYNLVVSPHLRDGQGYVSAGVKIGLPGNPDYVPAPDALDWHYENVFLR